MVMLYPLARLAARRAAGPLRRPAASRSSGGRQPRVAVRPRRGPRAADGNAATEREVSDGRTEDAILGGSDGAGNGVVAMLVVVFLVKGLPNAFGFRTYPLEDPFRLRPRRDGGHARATSGIRIGEVESIRLATTTRACS